MSATPRLQIVHRSGLPVKSAYDLTDSERAEAKALFDAYHLIMFVTDTPYVSGEGLEVATRVQKYLCDRYNAILLKGWKLQ